MNKDKSPQQRADELGVAQKSTWGQETEDHFGYKSDAERRDKRGLEDWELVEKIPESQRGVPMWFVAVIIVVLLVAVGLSFPFWGDRPGYERQWIDWGFGAALLYIAVMSVFVYFMVNLYGSNVGGTLDTDQQGNETKGSEPSGDAASPPQTGKDSDKTEG